MTVDFALRLASAAARVLAPDGGTALIGKDTRLSGYMFEAALEAGFVAAGVDVLLIGPLPTPGIAYMTQRFGCRLRRRDQRLAQPVRRQRHQVLRRHGSKLSDELEERSRRISTSRRSTRESALGARDARRQRRATLYQDSAPRRCRGMRPRRASRSSSTARTAPPTRWRRACWPISAPRSFRSAARRTAATSTTAAARRAPGTAAADGAGRAAPTSASRSTATATGW